MIAFCKYIKGINTGGGGSRERGRVLLKLKHNVGTGTNAYKLSKLNWKLGDGVSKSAEPSHNSSWEQEESKF